MCLFSLDHVSRPHTQRLELSKQMLNEFSTHYNSIPMYIYLEWTLINYFDIMMTDLVQRQRLDQT